MFLKFVVFAFLLASPILASPESQKLGFRNEHLVKKSIVESVKNIIQKHIETAREVYVEALENIHKLVEYVENEFAKDINKFYVLDDEIADCYAKYQQKILELNQSTGSQLKNCVSDVVAELTQLFNSLVESLNEVNERLLALLDELSACTNFACSARLAKEIAEEVLNVNGVMGDKITEFMAILRENNEAKVCVSNSLKDYVGKAEEVVAEFRECAQQ